MADRTLPNPERGCGTLKRGKAYIRGTIGSADGVLSSFVRCDPPIPYREMGTDGSFTRGYQQLAGVSAEAALEEQGRGGGITKFVPEYPGDATHGDAVANMVDRGLYDGPEDVPEAEYQRHVDRIARRGTEGAEHFGGTAAVRQSDLLMRAGKTHYPDPSDFIDEAIEHGISKAIPLSKRQDPPEIQPGGTRCWIVHPDTDVGWAVIGYAYLQEVVFTEPEDGNVPQYVQEHAAAGRLDVVDFEAPPDEATANGNATVDDFANDDTDDADEGDVDALPEPDDPPEVTDVPDGLKVDAGSGGPAPDEADADDDADAAESEADPDDVEDEADADATDTAPVVVPDLRDNDQDVRELPREDTVDVLLTTGADHVRIPGANATLCGRGSVDPADERLFKADSSALVKDTDFDVCGTCLSALKARTNDEDDDSDD